MSPGKTLDDEGREKTQTKFEDQGFSYKGELLKRHVETNADAGTNYLDGTAVPAGEVWVICWIMAYNNDRASSTVTLRFYDGSSDYWAKGGVPAAQYVGVSWAGEQVLEEGHSVQATLRGATAGDDLYLFYGGYKMTKES